MNRTEELQIIERLLEKIPDETASNGNGHQDGNGSEPTEPAWFNLSSMAGLPEISRKSASIYLDENRFDAEAKVFRSLPMAAAFSAEVESGNYIRRRVLGLDLIISRSASPGQGRTKGQVQSMQNICRHRAARLCSKRSGRGKIVCPYHAWVYNLTGERVAAPGVEGFGDEDVSLHTLPTVERHGIIWIRLDGSALTAEHVDDFLGPQMSQALEQINLAEHQLLGVTEKEENVNWKLAVEGGLENYHFGPTHAGTVGPQFFEQAGGLVRLGEHLRFITPRRSMSKLHSKPEERRHLRPHAFITFLVMPNLNIFLERHHVAIHLVMPHRAQSLTMINISLLPPETRNEGKAKQYFQTAHEHTDAVLEEDYTIHRSQMDSMRQKPDLEVTFGKQEGGIKVLHHWLDSLID